MPLAAIVFAASTASAQQTAPELLFRLDDMGMSHSVNTAIARAAEQGIPFSVSVLFVAPWYQEAVEILKRHPAISVGVHLALNSEWKGYRWGPVLGQTTVPTLVDSNGYFVHSTAGFLALKYDVAEVERELDAQIARALRSGLTIDYVDYHMGTAVSTPELRAIVERIAARHKLGVSRYFGESSRELFSIEQDKKTATLAAQVHSLALDRPNLIVLHVAEDTPEMRALIDMNSAKMNTAAGVGLTSGHRTAELQALLSPDVSRALRETGARMITYRDLIRAKGLTSMKRP